MLLEKVTVLIRVTLHASPKGSPECDSCLVEQSVKG